MCDAATYTHKICSVRIKRYELLRTFKKWLKAIRMFIINNITLRINKISVIAWNCL